MSKLYDIREALADSIAEAGIFPREAIIIRRQTDLFNEIATALATATNGVCLHIGIAEGKPTDDATLEYEVTVPLTTIVPPEIREDVTPEEDLWEALLVHVHDLKLKPDDHWHYRFRAGAFGDIDVKDDNGSAYLGRQTFFTYKLLIKP